MLIRAQWDGDAFTPTRPYKPRCDDTYVIGEIYDIDPMLPRSMRSHRHFFAKVHEMWETLPEGLEQQYPTAEHLRAKMLIKVGWCDQEDFVFASENGAREFVAYMQRKDTYAVIEISGQVVRISTAKSQAMSKQDRKDFQHTKQRVLDEIANLLDGGLGDSNAAAADHDQSGDHLHP